MAIRSGLSTQFGIKLESVYGTAVTPDRFTYINSESMKADIGKIESPFLGGLTLRTSQVSTYTSGGMGDIEFPYFNKGMGTLLKAALGTAVVAQVGATAEYTHTFTPDTTNGLVGISATLQVLKPNTKGSLINPFTFEGAKCTSFEISVPDKGLLILKTSWVCEDVSVATALASASYATGLEMFNWANMTVTFGGSAVFLRSFSVKGDWGFDTERRGLSQTLRKEPIPNASPGLSITGTMAGEFEDLTLYNAFAAGTQDELVFTAEGSEIGATGNPFACVITCAAVEFSGDTPVVGGPGILEQPAPFRALDNGTDPIISVVNHTDETAL